MSEDEIANCCPVCCGNCNCKACLRMEGLPAVSFVPHAHSFRDFYVFTVKKLICVILFSLHCKN